MCFTTPSNGRVYILRSRTVVMRKQRGYKLVRARQDPGSPAFSAALALLSRPLSAPQEVKYRLPGRNKDRHAWIAPQVDQSRNFEHIRIAGC